MKRMTSKTGSSHSLLCFLMMSLLLVGMKSGTAGRVRESVSIEEIARTDGEGERRVERTLVVVLPREPAREAPLGVARLAEEVLLGRMEGHADVDRELCRRDERRVSARLRRRRGRGKEGLLSQSHSEPDAPAAEPIENDCSLSAEVRVSDGGRGTRAREGRTDRLAEVPAALELDEGTRRRLAVRVERRRGENADGHVEVAQDVGEALLVLVDALLARRREGRKDDEGEAVREERQHNVDKGSWEP